MSFKPEDVRIPYNERNEVKKESSRASSLPPGRYKCTEVYDDETRVTEFTVPEVPPMYNQAYVDSLKDEIEYYQKRYRDLLLTSMRIRHGP